MAMAPPLGFEGSGEKMSEGGVEKQYQHQHQQHHHHHGPVPRWQPNSIPQRPLVQPAQREEKPGAREEDGGDDDDDVRAGFLRIYAALCPLRPSTSTAYPPAGWPTAPSTRRTASCSRRKSGRGASTGLFAWRAGLKSSCAEVGRGADRAS